MITILSTKRSPIFNEEYYRIFQSDTTKKWKGFRVDLPILHTSKVHMDKDMIEKDITIGPVKIRPSIQLSEKEMKSQSLRTI